ncbi:MAG TPA: hypothetical protein VF006_06555 [Longimicrobium sp.]
MATINLIQNIPVSSAGTGGQTSTVGEPSVANTSSGIFVTGNWYASRSTNGGAAWSYISPYNTLPPANRGFCCDQTLIHVRSHQISVWLLQYVKDTTRNTLRVAVTQDASFGNAGWHWWDLTPVGTNPAWNREWFDYNHAALSDNYLYVASNVFTISTNRWKRAVVFRIPLRDLASGSTMSYSYFETTSWGSLRCTQGARDVMYFAGQGPGASIQLFTWPESSTTVTDVAIAVSPWLGGTYSAPGPDGKNWLGRCDPRITGGWVANGRIGFMWTANRLASSRPFPYVRVVRIDAASRTLVDEPDIWSPDYAYAYPDAYPNEAGEVGITLFRGGGARYPGHVVGAWDTGSGTWLLAGTRDGTNGPADGKWGDYLTCRRDGSDPARWIATGYTLQGGDSQNFIEPRVVQFSL